MTWQIMALLLIPSLLYYFGLASSMALGTSLTSTVILLFGGRRRARVTNDRPSKRRHTVAKAIALVLTLVVSHSAIASLNLPVDAIRAVASLVPLALLIWGAAVVARQIQALPSVALLRSLNQCFVLMCGIAVIGAIGLSPPSPQIFSRPVFPFSEPSHFALAFTPLLMFVCVTSTGWRRVCALLVGMAAALVLENLTLATACALVAAVCLRPRAVLVLGGLLALAAAQLDLSYFASRLDFGADNHNLSTLVYVQGWQMLQESWQRSRGFGLGFQQLGVHGTSVDAADLIQSILGQDLNLLDGGFNLSKLVSEFGAFGVAICMAYLVTMWRAVGELRLASATAAGAPSSTPVRIFACCAVVSYSIEIFVRGDGYFSPTGFLLVCGLWVMGGQDRVFRSSSNQQPPQRLLPSQVR